MAAVVFPPNKFITKFLEDIGIDPNRTTEFHLHIVMNEPVMIETVEYATQDAFVCHLFKQI